MVVVQTTLFFGMGVVATMDLVWFMIMLLMLLWWLMIMLLIGSFTSGWYALSWLQQSLFLFTIVSSHEYTLMPLFAVVLAELLSQ